MIELQNVSRIYYPGKPNEQYALKDISLKIKEGELIAVVGKSGAGKSTLLHLMGGIDVADTGELMINGTEIKKLSEPELNNFRIRNIGIVLQNFALVDDYSVFDNVSLPLRFSTGCFSGKGKMKHMVMEALHRTGIEELERRTVNTLSGGQKQRVAIARAIVTQAPFLLADEPTGALDSKTSGEIMELFLRMNALGTTVIIVTHNYDMAAQCRRIIELSDGEIISDTGEKE
ncbi:MAG: ABC transporter ATP-binding protein [Clostridia bacterium]|nr:ABC transporter ATP-binding protein [Clostridia bacterium]